MDRHERQCLADYMMPAFAPRPSDPGFLFGTRHGVPEFCRAALALRHPGTHDETLDLM